ncbi:MAG: hypothetical protein DRN21_03905 [Thermoplasmata archaeon]|nr:MAG: hypothetical protein FE046_00165 [Thermoplasmata archaeon]RLF31928.1 MAG: hypothetical protein DRN07_06160 [Thermoplasmata archaeon]RLF39209.1 MAG: hypothetical protein DRN21_03905 [Thermoplasmata archaeon]HDN51120.1 hypothetical protein [Thermoplasmatales archaeon]
METYGDIDVDERLKNCIINVKELMEDIELVSTEEISCLVVALAVKLNERVTGKRGENDSKNIGR